jgi:predicted secreted protein
MASIINGSNVVLYYTNPNPTFYFNGSTSVTTIAGESYKQFGSMDSNGVATNFTKSSDGIVARFITDIPTLSIPAGTWTFTASAAITGDLTGAPRFSYFVYKYNGTTLTLISGSNAVFFTQLAVKEYSITYAFPGITLLANERIVIHVVAGEIGVKTMTFYTQGTNKASAITTIPVSVPFGSATNCSFDVSVDQKEVTSQTSAWFKEYRNDVASWSISADGFVALNDYSYLFIANLQLTRQSILIKFQIDNDNGNGSDTYGYSVFAGIANLSSLSITGGVEDASTYSVSLQGSGAYTISGTQVTPTNVVVKGTNVVMFDYIAAGAETTVTWTGAIGLSCVTVTRGGIEVRTIGVSGAPTGENVTFNSSTGTITFARALESDEFVRAIFK